MAGGLMQLVAYGAQDVYLTGNAQITFFKVVYRRHTNFSMECIELSLNGTPDFGRRSTVTITRNGDLITKMYLLVTLNQVIPSANLGAKFGWVRKLGNALIDYIEVEIGGSKIDKQYGVWLNIWYELARDAGKQERGYAKLVGDVPELTSYNSDIKPEYKMFVPLKFWFNRHVGLALPLIALQYHEVRLNFEFNNVAQLIVANDAFKANDANSLSLKDVQLLVDYIYLDSEERRRFAQVGHEYLIEQLQFTGTESVNSQTGKYKLDFNHPTKELIWAVTNGNYTSGQKFVCYTNAEDWTSTLEECAEKILRESIALLSVEENVPSSDGDQCTVLDGEQKPECGEWEEFCPEMAGCTTNGKIYVRNESKTKALWVSTSTLQIGSYNLTDKIWADILVCEDATTVADVKVTITYTDLTVRDISFPVSQMTDTRARSDDPCVYEPTNYGVLIDGTGNPVAYGLIQLNGHDRFDRREGSYFNYVQPYQHHTNTPSDGINVYSFALYPEQHQPSGTANLSRIDNTQLNLWFADPTFISGLPTLNIFNPDNKLYIFDVNYNILRVMSGMGGLAYSN
jgi:Large eukaryotic DNA virus major capsid protein/Major capsid protein N-terminus